MEGPAYGSVGTNRLIQRMAFLEGAKGCIQSHGDEVGRHAVGGCLQRLAQVLAHVRDAADLGQLQAVADRLGDLRRRDLLVARAVGGRVHHGNRPADPLGGGGHYSAGLRGPTTTRRSGSSPMLELVTSGSPSSARWIARRSNGCIASSVMASPVIFTCRAARIAISRTVCSRRCRYRSTSTITRSPSARCLPTITLVTACSARSVSPRQPISAPRSRPLMSRVMGSEPVRTLTWARTPMCLRRPSTRLFAASALPLAGAGMVSGVGAFWSITVTSTRVSSGVSLRILTSTLRRLSWSSISAASTASSSVRPRPSADFKCLHSLPCFSRRRLFDLLDPPCGPDFGLLEGPFSDALLGDGLLGAALFGITWLEVALLWSDGAPPATVLNLAGNRLPHPTTKLC